MPEMISDPNYWAERLRLAKELHTAVFRCPRDLWQRIEIKHREILARTIQPQSSVLDCGCGWGRLLTLLPDSWQGRYLGVDLCPQFVGLAYELHPIREFVISDLRELHVPDRFDLAVLVSIRPMVRRELGDAEWARMEERIREHTAKLLFLEYDEADEGSLE